MGSPTDPKHHRAKAVLQGRVTSKRTGLGLGPLFLNETLRPLSMKASLTNNTGESNLKPLGVSREPISLDIDSHPARSRDLCIRCTPN